MPLPDPEPHDKPRRKRRVIGEAPKPKRVAYARPDPEPIIDEPDWRVEVPDEEGDGGSGLTARQRADLKATLAEIANREREALRIFCPMEEQERFFASDAGERVVLGGNRGGKTTTTVVEIARATTGQDPYGKYPERDGVALLVGQDLQHCSKVFYKKLFKKGAIRVIRDLETGAWRTYRPDSPSDLARPADVRLSPPLIPARFYDYDRIAWENKKDEIPKTIPLKNGWTIHFFSSKGAPPQGWDVDLVVFDEEIEHPLWYPEMAARLLDRRTVDPATGRPKSGKFIWSATPQAGTQQLYDLKVRADAQRAEEADAFERGEIPPPPTIECYALGLLGNQFLAQSAKDDLIAKFAASPDEYAVRVEGKFALLGMRVYGEFAPKGVHGIEPFPVPENWCRYAAIDPGRQVCAVLFVAIPPPDHAMAGQKVLYDELYIRKCDAVLFAKAMKEKIGDQVIENWWIDHHAGRIVEIASGKSIEQQYSEELRKLKVGCARSDNKFSWGSDDVQGGLAAVHKGLHIIDGRSEWVVMKDKCPNLLWEAERYSNKKLPSGVITDEPIKLNDHLMDCWRYLAQARLAYVRPRRRTQAIGYTNQALAAKRERAKHRGGFDGTIKVG